MTDAKVFAIGLSRTGCTSIRYAFEMLGYNTKRDEGTWSLVNLSNQGLVFNEDSEELQTYDAFSDNPLPLIYPQLDQACPGSKFILTTREMSPWLSSMKQVFEWWHQAQDQVADKDKINATHQAFYGSLDFHEQKMIRAYQMHVLQVHQYFRGRESDFLEIDLTAEKDPWQKICGFLNRKIPDQEFPHANKTK